MSDIKEKLNDIYKKSIFNIWDSLTNPFFIFK